MWGYPFAGNESPLSWQVQVANWEVWLDGVGDWQQFSGLHPTEYTELTPESEFDKRAKGALQQLETRLNDVFWITYLGAKFAYYNAGVPEPQPQLTGEEIYNLLYAYVSENAEKAGTELTELLMNLLVQKRITRA